MGSYVAIADFLGWDGAGELSPANSFASFLQVLLVMRGDLGSDKPARIDRVQSLTPVDSDIQVMACAKPVHILFWVANHLISPCRDNKSPWVEWQFVWDHKIRRV